MILFDSKFRKKNRDAVKKARAEKIRCLKLRNGLYYAARKSSEHGEYLVYVESTDSGMYATCRTIKGGPCPAYGTCVHLATVYERMVAEGFRIERKERKDAA